MKKYLICYCLLGLLIQNNCAESNDDATSLSASELAADFDVSEQSEQEREQQEKFEQLLADIEKRYGETAFLLKSLHRKIEQKRQNLDKIRAKIQAYQQQLDKESKALATQVKSAYVLGQEGKLKLLINQQDPALSNRMMLYYNYFNKARLTKLAQIEDAVKRLDELDLQQQNETTLLEKDLEQKQAEQLTLNNFRKQRNQLLKQTEGDFSSDVERLSQLQSSANKLKKLVASLPSEVSGLQQAATILGSNNEESTPIKDNFSELKGKLAWPVKGKLTHNFSNSHSEDIRDGVLIEAKEGTEIHAVTHGKIIYADWLRGYGLLIIIEHDNRYMTLYGFNQSFYKQVGDLVERGDIIASVGQSDGRSQSGLYFGIRKQGEPIDPMEWFKK